MAQPRIIIVGGGFGGLAAAKALKNALMTAPGVVPEAVKRELAPIVGKYLK